MKPPRAPAAAFTFFSVLCSFAYPSVHSLHLATLTASKTDGAATSEYAAQLLLASEHIQSQHLGEMLENALIHKKTYLISFKCTESFESIGANHALWSQLQES